MGKFKEFLDEVYVDSTKNFYKIFGDIFENPTQKELMECSDGEMVKGIIISPERVLTFSPELMHSNVIDKLRLNANNIVTIEIATRYPKDKSAHIYITTTNTFRVKEDPETVNKILHNTYLNKIFKIKTVMDTYGHELYTATKGTV